MSNERIAKWLNSSIQVISCTVLISAVSEIPPWLISEGPSIITLFTLCSFGNGGNHIQNRFQLRRWLLNKYFRSTINAMKSGMPRNPKYGYWECSVPVGNVNNVYLGIFTWHVWNANKVDGTLSKGISQQVCVSFSQDENYAKTF